MPIYEYHCTGCDLLREEMRKVEKRDDDPPCSKCGGRTKRVVSRTSFALKGGGWYADSYSNDKKV